MATKPARSAVTKPNPTTKPRPGAPKSSRSAKTTSPTKQPTLAPSQSPRSSKQSQLIDLLRSDGGATVDEMIVLTGWQPHTVRGTISGVLRKRLGLDVQCAVGADPGKRVYRINSSVAAA